MTGFSACLPGIKSRNERVHADMGQYFVDTLIDRGDIHRLRRMRLIRDGKEKQFRTDFLTILRSKGSPLFRQRRAVFKAMVHWFHRGLDTHDPDWKLQYMPLYGTPALHAASLLGNLTDTLEEAEKNWTERSMASDKNGLEPDEYISHGGIIL